MSSSSPASKTRVFVSASEPAAEVMIINADFRRLAYQAGELEIDVEPGLYKLKWVVGSAAEERLVEVPEILPAGQETIEFGPESVAFASAAPLAGTSTFDQEQADYASTESRKVHRKFGSGSQIFLFVRDSKFTRDSASPRPWEKISLEDFSTLGDRTHLRPDIACACLSVEVDPGVRVLSVDTSVWGTLQMSVVTLPGWQTQVFLDLRDFQRSDEEHSFESRRADLDRASVFMARLSPVSEGRPRGGFDPDSPALHTSELLRQGIERRRPLLRCEGRLRDEVRRLLASEAPDPMLGIYALHLLLQESSADTAWLQEIRDRLRDLGLAGHPDLQAVELVFEGPSKDASFERPPLLLQSWQRIVAASVRKIDLVPAGFLAFDISTQVVRGGAWLVWRKPGSGAINKKNKAAKYGKKPSRFDLFTGLDELSKATPRTRKASMHMGHLAQTVLAAIETEISQRDRPSNPEELAHRLVDRLGLPAAYLEEQVREILRKLGRKRPTGAGPRKAKIET